jgi:hypothetical protein
MLPQIILPGEILTTPITDGFLFRDIVLLSVRLVGCPQVAVHITRLCLLSGAGFVSWAFDGAYMLLLVFSGAHNGWLVILVTLVG